MLEYLKGLSDRGKLLFGIIVFTVTTVSVFFLLQFRFEGYIIAGVVTLMLLITYPVWLPASTKIRVRLASLALAALAVANNFWPTVLIELIRPYFPDAATKIADSIGNLSSIPTLVFLLLVILIVNYFSRDATAMGVHENPIDKDIPDPKFSERMQAVVDALVDDLIILDNKTNWSMSYFTPLDAEVEVNSKSLNYKSKKDLLTAIKSSKERLFLVLGDPGSGKSVALRKLARELAKESKKTGKIPVYINLKEWIVEEKWTEQHLPTVEGLNQFILGNLKNRDIVTARFFDKYYSRLYETGRLYFILDSFDEIPSVLDERDDSILIHQLSEVIFRFLKGARIESQGVLASRLYRKPTYEFQSNVTLEIYPFEDDKIIQTLQRSNSYDKSLSVKLFKERPELVAVAKNPFAATLIADFAENNNNNLPANQAEMYKTYIDQTLKTCSEKLEKANISIADVYKCCKVIAMEMFDQYGLEIPVKAVKQKFPTLPIEEVTEVLRFARLGRGISNDTSKFSFVHRRFAEYFFVLNMLDDDSLVDLESIPTDSQQRDALVLYCEIAEENKAARIAQFCWEIIKNTEDSMNLKSIHATRFLRDAFRGRIECLKAFKEELETYTLNQINPKSQLISLKLASEMIFLLSETKIEIAIQRAISLQNNWINETTIKSIRHLDHLSKNTIFKIKSIYSNLETYSFIKSYKEYLFILNISNSLKPIFNFLKIKTISLILIYSVLFFHIIINFTYIYLFFLLMPLLAFLFLKFMKNIFMGIVGKGGNTNFYNLSITVNFFTMIALEFAHAETSEGVITLNTNYLFLLFVILITVISLIPLIYTYLYIMEITFVKLFKSVLSFLKSLIYTIILSLIIVFLFTLISRLFKYFDIHIDINHLPLEKLLIITGSLFLIRAAYIRFFSYLNFKNYIKSIKPNMTRDSIFNLYQKTALYHRPKLLTLLRLHVKTVTGEWPEKEIFTNLQDENITKLAQLDEKWLGLDR